MQNLVHGDYSKHNHRRMQMHTLAHVCMYLHTHTHTHTQVFYGDDCRICDARSPPDFADWLKITCVSSLLW